MFVSVSIIRFGILILRKFYDSIIVWPYSVLCTRFVV